MPQERQFNPYTDNGGTILAISSKNFAVIAGDTRQSEGYSIQTRYAPKVTQLTDYCCIAVNGFAADGNELVKQIKQRLQWYNHIHACQPSVQSIARLIQTMLYAKRFFPYYVYVILAGIDHDGTGAVYSFDPVGSYERESCRAAGAAQSLVQPFLDNQVGGKNMTRDPLGPPPQPEPTYEKGKSYTPPRADLPMEKVQALVIDAFTGAAERHIEVGDGLEIFIIEVGKGVQVVRRELKKD
ncbi:nucleophile aminohydrolase [Phakopsora pachyrhizi]|uniref:Nucleophile aminohydrolase n=1 Tax=Phakopsora pachyrhizi TaxID=170000 RepID=A0AAV0AZI1_PHAPC|nr:nucleophile aminohydrolase [Phakopsora pachyrhizi]